MSTATTRQEHLDWCKKRALEYLDAGDCQQAFASFLSDVTKHPETRGISQIIVMLGMPLSMMGHLNTPQKMREYITGHN